MGGGCQKPREANKQLQLIDFSSDQGVLGAITPVKQRHTEQRREKNKVKRDQGKNRASRGAKNKVFPLDKSSRL